MTKLFITTIPGLGELASEQLQSRFGKSVSSFTIHKLRNNDVVQFSFGGDVEDLMAPSIAEDVFIHIDTPKLFGSKSDLENIRKIVANVNLTPLFAYHHLLGKKIKHIITARAVVQATDEKWRHYRRKDIQDYAERGLAINLHKKFKIVEDDSDVELWLLQNKQQLSIGLRLTDRSMRHRNYKVSNYPGSLRPTVANALVYLSQPQAHDIFLDPMCGAGTILIERALTGRYSVLLGGDDKQEAVDATVTNFGTKHKPWQIAKWDALKLPLENKSVNKIVTNPPWGVQMQFNQVFYNKLFAELARVLSDDGLIVMIVKSNLLQTKSDKLTLQRRIDGIHLLGQWASICVFSK